MLEGSLNDEEEREFDLMEHDGLEKPHIHDGIEMVNLEAQDEATNEDITIREKYAHIQVLMDKLARAKYVISYLDQENKQISEKQVLVELELLNAKRQGDKGKSLMQEEETTSTLTTKQWLERRLRRIEKHGLTGSICIWKSCYKGPIGRIKSLGTWLTITGPRTRFGT